ncbi:hypothetical protein BSLG_003705 [Batrachochytrium salamandrivorans]|nr:hypothetical protein BSLG_003705 [Batrachochytrium salamandrivorans]
MSTLSLSGKPVRTRSAILNNLGLKLPNGVEIMGNVSGVLRSGHTCAIMGPSGAGKTTFVTLLTGKVARTWSCHCQWCCRGAVQVQKLIGYVPQEDIMMRDLTVRDILMHSARASTQRLGLRKDQGQGLNRWCRDSRPHTATFRQFDDFMLLGKGGHLVYMGPREDCVKYFQSIGFTCPPDESPSDFFMDVATGKVPSEFSPAFKPRDLFDYWVKSARVKSITNMPYDNSSKHGLPKRNTRVVILAKSMMKPTTYIEAPKVKDYSGWTEYIASGIGSIVREWGVWLYDIISEFGEVIVSFIYNRLLMKRAILQVWNNPQPIIVDMLLHFSSGLFISIAVQNFKFIGAMPGSICATAPVNMQWRAIEDHLREAGMFIGLGSLFAGISVGANTFGREKVVYWRDTASGMNTIPYFLAKFIVDFPRVILGGSMFFLALVLFFPYSQSAGHHAIVACLYFNAFAMGYWISTAFPIAKSGLIATGFALLWALVLSGVLPNLNDVSDYPPFFQFFWKISAPRWSVESFWLAELQSLDWAEKNKQPTNTYQWANSSKDLSYMLIIAVGWNVLAFLGMKLFNRDQTKVDFLLE